VAVAPSRADQWGYGIEPLPPGPRTDGKTLAVLPGTVHPTRLSEPIADLRLHPAELTANQILPFIPKAADIDPEKDPRLGMLTRIVAECSTVHACATAVMQLEPWDFMAVYYDALDHFGHGFMKYHPPKQKHIPEADFELYRGVVEGGYRFHDMMLGVLLKLAGEDTTVILISDHGFHPDDLRPARIPHEPAGPAIEHSPYGIFAMKGAGIKKDERIYGASLLDITPTILTLFDLPVGEDMDGKPLVECFEAPPVIETIDSWELEVGDAGLHPPDQRMDPADAREAIGQLVALGYIEDPGDDKERAIEKTVNEARYNLAQSYIDANRYYEALPLLEALWESEPEDLRFANRLAHCYQVLDRLPEFRQTIETLIETQARLARKARKKLKQFAQRQIETKEEELSAEGPTEEEKVKERLQVQKEKREIQRLRALARPRKYWGDYLMGCLLFAEENHSAALEHLKRAEKAEPRLPFLHLQIGHIYLRLKLWKDAESAFAKALDIDPDSAQAHLGMCQSLLPRRRNLEAAEEALAAVGLLYHYPRAHFALGVALHRLGHIDRSVEALQVALAQNPNFIEAHKRLFYIYRHRLKDPEKAEDHRKQIKEISRRRRARAIRSPAAITSSQEVISAPKDTPKTNDREIKDITTVASSAALQEEIITVVSGLPRSGTSMMMQILQTGGLGCLTDSVREADEDNPRGYFEFEQVKKLRTDSAWLADARGGAVKVIAQLLPFLPVDYHYRVIFMERDLDEVLMSQRKMLDRQGLEGARISDARLSKTFAQQVRQAKSLLAERHIQTLYVSYGDAVEHPDDIVARLFDFLGQKLDAEAMARAVDRGLYRTRQN